MNDTIVLSVEMTTMTCNSEGCGITFSVPTAWREARLRDHSTWYCPNGHPRHFPGKSDLEKLRDDLLQQKSRAETLEARLATARAEAHHRERQLSAAKGQVTKIKRRVGNGVCPCCGRTFKQLAEHMKTKHPDYAKAALPASPGPGAKEGE